MRVRVCVYVKLGFSRRWRVDGDFDEFFSSPF